MPTSWSHIKRFQTFTLYEWTCSYAWLYHKSPIGYRFHYLFRLFCLFPTFCFSSSVSLSLCHCPLLLRFCIQHANKCCVRFMLFFPSQIAYSWVWITVVQLSYIFLCVKSHNYSTLLLLWLFEIWNTAQKMLCSLNAMIFFYINSVLISRSSNRYYSIRLADSRFLRLACVLCWRPPFVLPLLLLPPFLLPFPQSCSSAK